MKKFDIKSLLFINHIINLLYFKLQQIKLESHNNLFLILKENKSNSSKSFILFFEILKYHLGFELIDMRYSYFFINDKETKSIVYVFRNYEKNLKISCVLPLKQNRVDSLSSLFPCCFWLEREIAEFGQIIFNNHGDLKALLLDYGFSGNILDKDYPLSGFKNYFYDEQQKLVVSRKFYSAQNFRNYNFSSPWTLEREVFYNDKKDGNSK